MLDAGNGCAGRGVDLAIIQTVPLRLRHPSPSFTRALRLDATDMLGVICCSRNPRKSTLPQKQPAPTRERAGVMQGGS